MSLEGESILLGLLVVLSAFFSGVETAYVSLSDIRVQHLSESGRKGIGLVRKLRENNRRLLITLLIGNNLVNIAASAVATQVALSALGDKGAGMALAIGFMTLIILVFGEITPKTMAMIHNEAVAVWAAPAIRLLQYIFWPAIAFLEFIANILARPMQPDNTAPIITEDEIKTVVSLGEEVGEVEADERIMIHNIFRFSDLEVCEIMTDRTRIYSVPENRKLSDVQEEIVRQGYSRVPVYGENRDDLVGILYVKDVLQALVTGKKDGNVRDLCRPVMFVPETMLLDDLLREFKERQVHLAMVVDEHGGVAGLVTIEDVLEEIVGDIFDESDKEPEKIKKIGKNKALVRGDTEVEEVNRSLNLGLNEHEDYETISGFVLAQLRRIPAVDEQLALDNASLRITKADQQHIIEVEIELLPPSPPAESSS